MKHLFSFAGGTLLGCAVAAVALYFNPITRERPALIDADTVLQYEYPSESMLLFTHGGALKVERVPPEIPQLWEATISKTALSVLVLRNPQGRPVAIASRMSKLSEQSEPLLSGLLLADNWLITYPGRGSYVVASTNNVWPLIRDTLIDVDFLQRPWMGSKRYFPTAGPDADGTALVTGATGEFRGLSGSATEWFELENYEVGPAFTPEIKGELQLKLGMETVAVVD
jgi:hypothetical protein